jgi:hypothetical protein
VRFSPVLLFHICAGTLAVFAGTGAMSFRKGSHRHGVAGNVFVISMLSLGATGAYLGFTKHQTLNGAMGVLTCYLVATAWWTAKRSEEPRSIVDLGALMVPLAIGGALIAYGLKAAHADTGKMNGYPAGAYFMFGFIALLFAFGDIRMLVRGGVSGTRRIARHLTRMCFAFFIAAGSFFLGRREIFPEAVRRTNVLYLLSFLPLILMLFWLIRVRFTNKGRAAFREQSSPG